MCIILGDRRTMSSRPGTDWHTIYSSCRKEAYHEKGCRWHAPAPEPGFLSMLQQKRMAAKEAVVSNEEEQTMTDGTNVGAAAFLPAAVLAQVAPQQKKQIPNPPGTGKKAQKKAKALAKQARQQEAMARSMNSIGMMAMGVSSGHLNPALNGGFSALPPPPPPPGHPGAMIPRRVMATGAPPLPNGTPPLPNGTPPLSNGTPRSVTTHPNGIAAPVPPPMPPLAPAPPRQVVGRMLCGSRLLAVVSLQSRPGLLSLQSEPAAWPEPAEEGRRRKSKAGREAREAREAACG